MKIALGINSTSPLLLRGGKINFMQNLKVFQVIPKFMFGGAEIMVENLSYALHEQGVEVHIISFFSEENLITNRIENKGIKIHYMNKKLGFDFYLFYRLYKLLKKEKPDVIHTHIGAIKYCAIVSIISGIKIKIHTFHSIASQETSKFNRMINKLYYKHFNIIPVGISQVVKKTISDEYGILSRNIPMIYNGEDLSRLQRKKHYFINEKIRIIHIGRFEEVKNHIGLVQVIEKLVKEFPTIELCLVGDGSLRGEIIDIVYNRGLSNNVKFLGLQSDVSKLLFDSDIFVLLSLYEGMPMTLIEAMATGLPIVATRVGGIPDMIEDNKTGILVSLKEEEIIIGIKKVIEDQELRERIGRSAILKSQEYTSKNMADRYLGIYRI